MKYLSVFLLAFALNSAVHAEDKVSFQRDIRPLLSDRCFNCHGPDSHARKAELRFDIRDGNESPLKERDGHFVIKGGNLKASSLWERITTSDPDTQMPPPDSNKKPFTKAQKELFRRWILEGGKFDSHWSFVVPGSTKAPQVDASRWNKNPIDRFVFNRLQQEGLKPQRAADKRILIRRVTFDLTGLPPTRAEIAAFLKDDSPQAYQRLVDNLLKRKTYGEHMAKYWLDLVRYADTNGIHHDHFREITPYRDWVIRAFNGNLQFNDFIKFQLAGDLYEKPSLDQKIASGFNRLHLVIDRGTALPEESFHRNVVDRVSAFGTAFLGLTVQCAVCHDHKYDPISQRDFYQLYAFFNNIDAAPETPGRSAHPPFIQVPNAAQTQQLAALTQKLQAAEAVVSQLKKKEEKQANSQAKPESGAKSKPQKKKAAKKTKAKQGKKKKPNPNKKPSDKLKAAQAVVEQLKAEKKKLEGEIRTTLVMKERAEVRPTFVKIRGAYDQDGDKVERNTPAFLPPLKAAGNTKSRMDLAKWVTSPNNPLTARVAVNRFWQQLFGVGLVKTSEDFGAQGEPPSHPELLDYLASNFIDTQWNVKQLIRSIVLSETYQQSSRTTPEAFRRDPENRLLTRGSRFRLDAEMIRDQILAVSGLLNREMFGRSVKPPQPPNLWKSVSMKSSSTYSFQADQGDKIVRRSLYTFWKRALPPPQMTIFDAPTRESCIARRERTNTPLQALVLMNESEYFAAARHLAENIVSQNKLSDEQRISQLYEAITSRIPDKREMDLLQTGFKELEDGYSKNNELTDSLVGKSAKDRKKAVRIAAYTMLINSLFNLDIAKTRE